MKLVPIIQRLRQQCPEFRNFVGGLAQWNGIDDLKHIVPKQLPVAWVIPAVDSASAPQSANGCRQSIIEGFVVIVAAPLHGSTRGELSADAMQDIKDSLLKALVGLRPAPFYEAIYYQSGGDILAKTDVFLVERFVFGSVHQFDSGIRRGEALTAQDTELMSLSPLNLIHVDADLAPSDGRAEVVLEVDFTKLQRRQS